jgi:amino acid adenylation domain-containing protein
VTFVEAEGGLHGMLSYRGDRLTAADAEQMARLLGRLLDRFADCLDQPVANLDLLDDQERANLAGFERGAPAAPPTTVPALLARDFARRPDAPAIVSNRGVLSYSRLDARARALAAKLRPFVRGEEPVVALALGRGEDLVVAMLAAWKAGCSFCPLDPGYPSARIDFILSDLDASAVLTNDPVLRERLLSRSVRVLSVADVGCDNTAEAGDATLPDPESTAYVLYTSGTTGQPKGVPIRHRSLAQFANWFVEAFNVGPSDRMSQVSSVGFDASLWEVWGTLTAGACLLPYERAMVAAPELARWLDEEAVTLCFAPTALAERLWSVPIALPRLRWLFFAGSALTRMPPPGLSYRVCNTYGPTETTIIVTEHVIDPEDQAPLNCIGRPIAGARLFVLDEAGRRCPIGVPGETFIGGAGVARGYWRRPELTRERFREADPDGVPGPVYRTGDQSRWLPDGRLEFLGRLDRQVKVSGYRVEPQEIEAILRRDQLVDYALVRATSGEAASLVAYLVPKPGAPRDTRAVLARLEVWLPDFMIPNAVIWMEELPISAHGKLDADRLRAPTRADLVAGTPWVEPTSDLERRIAEVWREVLHVDAVGAHDNFFDLGGNSLLLASLHRRLEEALEMALPIRTLFEFPTVYTLARAHSASAAATAGPAGHAGLHERAARARQARAVRRQPRVR